jgi:hypothetical protein
MAIRDKEPKPEREEVHEEKKVHDLPPRKDVKGGTGKEKQNGTRRTAEMDFSQLFD